MKLAGPDGGGVGSGKRLAARLGRRASVRPCEGLGPGRVPGRRRRRPRCLSWGSRLFRVLYAPGCRGYRVPRTRLVLAVSDGTCGLLPCAVRRSLAPATSSPSSKTGVPLGTASRERLDFASGSIEPSASLPSRVLRFGSAAGVATAGAFHGVRGPSSRRHRAASVPRGSHPSRPFRPRRFARPRRLAPPSGSWVCFTPLPRPGFALQGFPPRPQPRRLVGDVVPSRRWAPRRCRCRHRRHVAPPRPQGLAPRSNPRSPRRGLAAAPIRSPPELRLLQVLPLDVGRTPSRPLPLVALARAGQDPAAPAFSSHRRRARHPLARLPTCPRFLPARPSRDVRRGLRFSSRRLNRAANRFRIRALCSACASAAHARKVCSTRDSARLALWTRLWARL